MIGRVLAALLLAASAGSSPRAGNATWQEVPWPFGRDAWPAGRAFRCLSPECGGAVTVYLRAKRGLCANCAAGVTEDSEVDATADLDMLSPDFTASAPGERVVLAGMPGRRRAYALRPSAQTALGAVVSRPGQCDLFVIAVEGPDTAAARRAVAALLDTPAMTAWTDAALEGR